MRRSPASLAADPEGARWEAEGGSGARCAQTANFGPEEAGRPIPARSRAFRPKTTLEDRV